MQYFNDMSKFWLSEPFYDTGSDGGNSDGNAQSDSGEVATDGEVSGNSDGNADVTGDATTQNDDSAQDGGLSHNELLTRHTELQGKYEKLGESYGKQTTVLGDLRRQVRGESTPSAGQSTATETASVTLTQDQFNELMAKRTEDPSGTATNAMQPLQQQVASLTSNVDQVVDHLLHERMARAFTPQELQNYAPRVNELGQQVINGTVSYDELLNYAVRGENVYQIINDAKKLGAKEYQDKLQTEANATIPSAGTGRQQSPGARQRKEVVSADDAHERMYGKKEKAS